MKTFLTGVNFENFILDNSDINSKNKTAMQELIDKFSNYDLEMIYIFKDEIKQALEKEKEQIQKAFSDGQETPINHPTLPHYSREEYYNDNYK